MAIDSTDVIHQKEHYKIGDLEGKGIFIFDAEGNQITDFGGVTSRLVNVLIDSIDLNLKYLGDAALGSGEDAAVWRIRRIDETNLMEQTWADGDDNFDNIWDDRESLSYS